ncbi:hypothetical protein [Psychromonas sp. Urea-02u-13]|uniref:hypothetical protein n=1 Tax=Psychromonas sp. Urea-02u-13 TaxID=2058326 RepID=UPI000C3456BA|nr:hypothetical protein [Psychromonas sp. Urea-02u-13]PKG37613.1 hypothetical protein CXF74_17955 [Psychromonas sp. Urea-02u-13]
MKKNDITFLHTAEVHVATFSDLVTKHQPNHACLPTLSTEHIVNSTLLEEAMEKGITPELEVNIKTVCLNAAKDAQRVVCTCSTLGQVAEKIQLDNGSFVIRIDRAMADLAVMSGNRILVLAALKNTLVPTEALMRSSQKKQQTQQGIDYCVVENSWQYFLKGQQRAYLQTIADVIDDVIANIAIADVTKPKQIKYDCIVLAQASMAGAIDLIKEIKEKGPLILSSPEIGIEALLCKLAEQKSKLTQ